MSEQFLTPQDWDNLVAPPVTPERPTKRLRDYDLPLLHQFLLMVISAVVSFLSVIPLYVPVLANGLQGQTFYMAWALTQGQLPYAAVLSRSGILSSGLVSLATMFGGIQWLILLQIACLTLAGTYLYKLAFYWTADKGSALGVTWLFYLVNAVFGFGGFYPVQLAIPFVLIGLWLLVTYFDDLRRDEIFIAYGLVSALALSLEPRTLFFWLLAFVTLSLVNIAKKRWTRGFYQQLAMVFGFILVIYPLAYYGVNLDLLTPYLQQAFIDNFASLVELGSANYLAIGLNALLILGLGLLTGLFLLPNVVKNMAEQGSSVMLLVLATVVYTAVALLGQSLLFTDLLLLLPFGLLLTRVALGDGASDGVGRRSSRRQKVSTSSVSLMKRHAYLPALLLMIGLAWRLSPLVTEQGLQAERETIAQYVSSQSDSDAKIYAWDRSASLYLTAQRLSASQLAVPTAYPLTPTLQQNLVDDLLQGQATYLVVNKAMPLPGQLKDKLATTYQEVPIDQVTHFTLYQLK